MASLDHLDSLRLSAIKSITAITDESVLREVISILDGSKSKKKHSKSVKVKLPIETPFDEDTLEQDVADAHLAYEKGECFSSSQMLDEINSWKR